MNLRLFSLAGLLLAYLGCTAQPVKIESIPQELNWLGEPQAYELLDNGLSITAGQGTDIYHYSGGGYNISTVPMLLFPADEEFVLTAKVKVDFEAAYDGGFLILYEDTTHYAKLLFEQNHAKQWLLCSGVTNTYTDDNVHVTFDSDEIYIRIARSGDMCGFYYSVDNENWTYMRFFNFPERKELKLGFAAQSPVGESCTAVFTEIGYMAVKPKDMMIGQ